MTAIIQTIASVEAYGENLSIITTSEGNQVIANRKEDGSFVGLLANWLPISVKDLSSLTTS